MKKTPFFPICSWQETSAFFDKEIAVCQGGCLARPDFRPETKLLPDLILGEELLTSCGYLAKGQGYRFSESNLRFTLHFQTPAKITQTS